MKFYLVADKKKMSEKAYEIMLGVINSKDQVTLGLATGGSPEDIYALFRANRPEVSHVTTVNLDEYAGLEPTHPQSYQYFMEQQLFNHLPFKASYVPAGVHEVSYEEAAKAYDRILEENPVDLQLLGIGENGHIAFNEPGSAFDAPTSVVGLTESTINANSRYFASKEEVPTLAVSMGIGSILKSKQILLIASGANKAQAIKDLVEQDANIGMPATALKNHGNAIVIVDEAAASLLSEEQKAAFEVIV
jgi:glucosamine-6-phosphate deaminase